MNYSEFGGAYDLYTLEAGMFTYALNSTVDHVITMGSIQRKLPPKLNNLDDKSQYSVYFQLEVINYFDSLSNFSNDFTIFEFGSISLFSSLIGFVTLLSLFIEGSTNSDFQMISNLSG